MRFLVAALFLSGFALVAGSESGAGQAPQGGTVNGTGSVELKRSPDTLRIQVEVLAKGKDLKEALAKLKERREAALAQLTALGVAATAVEFGEPAITSEKTDRQLQMERMVKQRMRGAPGKDKGKAKETPPVVVSTSLKAELPLKAATTEELLVSFQALQDKIKAADLGGLKELAKMSPQEEEIAEENQAMMMGMGGEEEVKRGEPMFFFVCKISDADRDKALADAFQKAKKEAGRLAQAAGAGLGALHHLDHQSQPSGGVEDYGFDPSQRYYRMRAMGLPQTNPDSGLEATGMQPGKVSVRIAVTATFTLKPAN
jgi:uncharacterized protein YggE